MHADKRKAAVALILGGMAKPEPTSAEDGDVGLETACEEFFSAGAAKDWKGAAAALKSALEQCSYGDDAEEPEPKSLRSYPEDDDDEEA